MASTDGSRFVPARLLPHRVLLPDTRVRHGTIRIGHGKPKLGWEPMLDKFSHRTSSTRSKDGASAVMLTSHTHGKLNEEEEKRKPTAPTCFSTRLRSLRSASPVIAMHLRVISGDHWNGSHCACDKQSQALTYSSAALIICSLGL